MLEIILFEGFCPLKIKIMQFPHGFRLNFLTCWCYSIWEQYFNVCTISCLQRTKYYKILWTVFHQHMYNFLFANTVEPCFTDTRLIQTPHCYGQFSLSLVLTASLNSTCLIWTLSMAPSVSVLMGFHCNKMLQNPPFIFLVLLKNVG